MSRETLAKYCLLPFLAINLPFWFLTVHVPLAAQRALGLGLLAIAGLALRRISLHPTIILLWIFFLLLNLSKFFLGNLSLQYTLWFTGLPVVIALAPLATGVAAGSAPLALVATGCSCAGVKEGEGVADSIVVPNRWASSGWRHCTSWL